MITVANMTTNGGGVLTNTKLLQDKIARSGLKINYLASKIGRDGITRTSLTSKINNKSQFKVDEMLSLCELLGLTETERNDIFFADM